MHIENLNSLLDGLKMLSLDGDDGVVTTCLSHATAIRVESGHSTPLIKTLSNIAAAAPKGTANTSKTMLMQSGPRK